MRRSAGASGSSASSYPNRDATIRLLGAPLLEQHEQWTTGHRYRDMSAYWLWRQEHHQPRAAQTPTEVTMQTA